MKITKLYTIFIIAIITISCNNTKRTPNRVYMPDMAYSRAIETYSDHKYLLDKGINYNGLPVKGTMSREASMPFLISKDEAGMSMNHDLSNKVPNPITSLNVTEKEEAERLYLVNCAICHGTTLNGNGPLYKDGNGPYPAKPAQLIGDIKYEQMPEGQMFYSVTYGKNLMGSYSSQLSTKQRWMIIRYIKDKQINQNSSKTITATTNKATELNKIAK